MEVNNVQVVKRQNKYQNSLFINSICNDFIFTDNIIFDKIQIQRQHYLTLKLIYVILIVCIGQLICKLVYAIKRSESVRTAVKFAGICFGILMVFLFLTYPGIWLWDNMEMLNMASTMKLSGWHGYYMQCFLYLH